MPESDQSGKLRYPSWLTVVLMAILEEQKPSERKQHTSVSVLPRTGQGLAEISDLKCSFIDVVIKFKNKSAKAADSINTNQLEEIKVETT